MKVSQQSRFIKILKVKIYKKRATNDCNPYLSYLNKLVDQYNNNQLYQHCLINEKAINADYSALTEKIQANPKDPNFKVNDRVRTTNYKNIFSKGYTKSWSREVLFIDSFGLINLNNLVLQT